VLRKIYIILVINCLLITVNGQTYVNNLDSPVLYSNLCGPPLTLKYGNITGVKVVIDQKKNIVYYINSKNYKFHYEFCMNMLNYNAGLGNFNAENYTNSSKRKYLLANINYFLTKYIYIIYI